MPKKKQPKSNRLKKYFKEYYRQHSAEYEWPKEKIVLRRKAKPDRQLVEAEIQSQLAAAYREAGTLVTRNTKQMIAANVFASHATRKIRSFERRKKVTNQLRQALYFSIVGNQDRVKIHLSAIKKLDFSDSVIADFNSGRNQNKCSTRKSQVTL